MAGAPLCVARAPGQAGLSWSEVHLCCTVDRSGQAGCGWLEAKLASLGLNTDRSGFSNALLKCLGGFLDLLGL